MATYEELFELRNNSGLRNKIAVACVVNATTLLGGTPTAAEAQWAVRVLSSPGNVADAVINAVLAANNSATPAQILGTTDATIQTNVDAVVAGLIAGQGVSDG